MRGDKADFDAQFGLLNFNPRPFVRGDLDTAVKAAMCDDFNPRPFVRGDGICHSMTQRAIYFNPRPFVRGDRMRR